MAKLINNDKLNKLINTIREDNARSNVVGYTEALADVTRRTSDDYRSKIVEDIKAQIEAATSSLERNPNNEYNLNRLAENTALLNDEGHIAAEVAKREGWLASAKEKLAAYGASEEDARERGYNASVTVGEEETYFFMDWDKDENIEISVKPIVSESVLFGRVYETVEGYVVTKPFAVTGKRYGVGALLDSSFDDEDDEEEIGGFYGEGATADTLDDVMIDRDFRPFSVTTVGVYGVKTVA